MDIKLIIKYLLFGRASGPLYFVIVLIQLTLITPVLIKCVNKKWCNYICILITPLYLVFMYIYNFKTKAQLPYYEVVFLPWFIFYYIGIYLNMKGLKEIFNKKTNKLFAPCLLTIALLLISCFECYFLISKGQTEGFATSQIKISSILYALSMINLFLVIKQYDTKMDNFLIKIGNNSFGIYFIHCFYLIIVNKLLNYIPYLNHILPIYQISELILTIALSYITIQITKQILGRRIANKIFGF